MTDLFDQRGPCQDWSKRKNNSAANPSHSCDFPTVERRKAVRQHTLVRPLGFGLATGAADDNCSAIGTYAQAGAHLGYKVLWTAPVTFPRMVAVVYLSGKLGQVTGQGLFAVQRSHSPEPLLYPILAGVNVGNVIWASTFPALIRRARWSFAGIVQVFFYAALDAADQQSPVDHGRQGKRPRDQRSRLDDEGRDLRRVGLPGL